MDTAAPITKTVADCALVFGTIAGHVPMDPYTSSRSVPDYTAGFGLGIQGLRVGFVRELYEGSDLHPEVKTAFQKALGVLQDLGAHVGEVTLPLVTLAGAVFVCIADTDGAGARDEILRTRADELDRASRTRLQSGSLVPAKVYNRAMKARILLRQQMMDALQRVDVLASPTSPFPPPRHSDLTAPFEGTKDVRARFFFRRSYTGCYSLAALPAISVPCGFTSNSLPIGLQLGARPFGEQSLLRMAHAYEQATPWHSMRAPAAE